MDSGSILHHLASETPARAGRACFLAGVLMLFSALAAAQEAIPRGQPPREDPGFFSSIGRWFDRQAENIGSSFKGARGTVETFGHEAGVAAKSTVTGAKDAADAVARIPTARVVSGHEKCKLAPNGAPDCIAAANAVCKTKGFEGGKSVDMTTAEVCPPQVYLSGRNSGGACRTETFVSRALCQ